MVTPLAKIAGPPVTVRYEVVSGGKAVIEYQNPGQSFEMVYEAVRIAITYRTPVIMLSDLLVANSSEPWRIPSAADLPAMFRAALAKAKTGKN